MKKLLTLIAASAVIFSASMAKANIDLGFTIGTAYPHELEQFSFDGAVSVDFEINELFFFGVQGAFNWIKKDVSSGDSLAIGDDEFEADAKTSQNIYTYPVLLNATFVFPVSGPGFHNPVRPFLSLGAGYAWSLYRSDEAKNYNFSGLAYQAMLGTYIDLGYQAQGMKIKLEAGYRGTDVKTDIGGKSYELPMSSWLARVGVTFSLGGGY